VAFFFGHGDRALFGAYDAPSGACRGAVLLVNPIGDDALRAHRPLRHLGRRLVEAGFAVLRFDFHGTGDSQGDEGDEARVFTWLADVRLAASELCARSGATSIDVVALRLGATLALSALARGPEERIRSLVLWGPYASGTEFHREGTRLYKMHRMLEPAGFSGGPASRTDGDEVFGFLLTHETVAALTELDVRTLARAPVGRALVIGDGSGARAEQEIAGRLEALDVRTETRTVPNSLRFLLDAPHRSKLPKDALDAIVAWLADASAHQREEPVVYSARGCVGVFHHGATRLDLPPIVLTSAGTVHRVGPHRLYVKLARRLARAGFRVLRVDLSGIGDSPAGDDGIENVTYPKDGYDDLGDAMDWLATRTGAERFIVAGLCSGGDFAFQTAMRDARVTGVVIMNPRTFCVTVLAEVESGNDPLVVAAAERARTSRVPVPESLRRIVERGVDTLLIVSEKDPGVHYVDTHWGDAMRALGDLPGFRREDVPGTDHNFTSIWAQQKVIDLCAHHLERRYFA
jgi:pimeloyl-ACP methyl ester carboxylesterase